MRANGTLSFCIQERLLLQCNLNYCKAISRNLDCHLLLGTHSVSLRLYRLSVVVVLEIWIAREDSTLCCCLEVTETAEVNIQENGESILNSP